MIAVSYISSVVKDVWSQRGVAIFCCDSFVDSSPARLNDAYRHHHSSNDDALHPSHDIRLRHAECDVKGAVDDLRGADGVAVGRGDDHWLDRPQLVRLSTHLVAHVVDVRDTEDGPSFGSLKALDDRYDDYRAAAMSRPNFIQISCVISPAFLQHVTTSAFIRVIGAVLRCFRAFSNCSIPDNHNLLRFA